jgi:hypothetical protein
MTVLTLSDDQARLVAGASTPVVVIDSQGKTIGNLAPVPVESSATYPISSEELVELKRRMANDDGTRYTTAEVLAYLRTLAPE